VGVLTVEDGGRDESEKVCKSGPQNVDIQSSGIQLTVQSGNGTLKA